ncbi:MAG: NAD(P)H-dependent glycerol-3-phosphate dehydrogenase [Flavobacteriales bacterium]|jgi:glycerol-3-phosphate dehydrogenase (NAD(P)+)|nr:NAD(P)H-dependent glycerol-3-phosphate dehydrogenase [Flavobacteriales bacterium]
MAKELRFGLLGSGSWATAIAKMLLTNVETLNWWVRREETKEYLEEYGRNPNYIQSISFNPEAIRVSTDMQEIIDNSDVIIFAIPSAHLDNAIQKHKPTGLKDKWIMSAIKGMVVKYDSIPARYFHKEFQIPYDRIGLIAGPCHAEEVAREKLSFLTVACPDLHIAQSVADALKTRYIRVKTSEDVFGTEIAAVLKNIYAIAAGMALGLGYGDNFLSVLISNASQEMKRFLAAVHEVDRDVKESAYLGDLLVTAYSPHSRNRNLGMMIGKGYSVKGAIMEMNMVAEGYNGSEGIFQMNKRFQARLPISDAVYRILHERMSPVIEMRLLVEELS